MSELRWICRRRRDENAFAEPLHLRAIAPDYHVGAEKLVGLGVRRGPREDHEDDRKWENVLHFHFLSFGG